MRLHLELEAIELESAKGAQPAIELDGISVRFLAPIERVGTFKEYAIRRLQRRVQFREFLALQDVSLQIERGETFGLIGRNGAGKSTLLKVIARVMVPRQGRVRVRGRVCPLLELGGAFHPELTGRENVFLNGALLGHPTREVVQRMQEIVEFAELSAFMEAPLRTFSSGMVARLGFALATAWTPEVLLLDEVLSVGDEAFQRKCAARMDGFRGSGTTTVLVSHDMNKVAELCNRAAWLDHGRIVAMGKPADVIGAYRASQAM